MLLLIPTPKTVFNVKLKRIRINKAKCSRAIFWNFNIFFSDLPLAPRSGRSIRVPETGDANGSQHCSYFPLRNCWSTLLLHCEIYAGKMLFLTTSLKRITPIVIWNISRTYSISLCVALLILRIWKNQNTKFKWRPPILACLIFLKKVLTVNEIVGKLNRSSCKARLSNWGHLR